MKATARASLKNNLFGIMNWIDDLCIAIGKIGRGLFEVVRTIFEAVITLFGHVLSWAKEFLNRCFDKIAQGWKMYYVDIDVNRIPPSVIDPEALRGATKVSLGLLSDKSLKKYQIDRAFVHNTEDSDLRNKMHGKKAIEITL